MVEHLAYPIFRPICSERVCLSSRLAEKQPNALSERIFGLFSLLDLLFAHVGATQEFPNNPDVLFQLLRPLVLGLAAGMFGFDLLLSNACRQNCCCDGTPTSFWL